MNTGVASKSEYLHILRDVIRANMNLLVAVNFFLLDESALGAERMSVDVWLTQPQATETWANFACVCLVRVSSF